MVSALVGLDSRTTMDIDTTLRYLPLSRESAERVVQEIIAVPVADNIRFVIKNISEIMDDTEYRGIRISLDAHLETMRIPLKIDISTGDVITPAEITYHYKLMFEDRFISLWAYTVETVLAEKIETILSRALTNTRLRDFYDVYLLQTEGVNIDNKVLSAAISATCRERGSEEVLLDYEHILDELHESLIMRRLWQNYRQKNSYVREIDWESAVSAVRHLCESCVPR